MNEFEPYFEKSSNVNGKNQVLRMNLVNSNDP